MPLPSGSRIGPYEVENLLGEGGMGEVYRARDTRLHREVAVKVVSEVFAVDQDRVARFNREAQLLASLNHPNIAAIYGFEESNGVRALILELVEGPTLADLIEAGRSNGPRESPARSPHSSRTNPARGLPVEDAVQIARQIADALETAHDQGIIHRDLKPANIKVRADGTVKILDFGLAKMLEPDAAAGPNRPGLSMSPTLSVHATMHGMILGTAAYMSPEQARGKPVDRRTDIWAFGCVLLEMLTGKPPFEAGETVADAVAAIIKNEPNWHALPSDTPPYLGLLLRRCLAKDPKKRLPHIGIVRMEIEERGVAPDRPASTTQVGTPTRSWLWRVLPWAVAGLAVISAGVIGILARRPLPPERGVVRFTVAPLDGAELGHNVTTRGSGAAAPQFALSPDGRRLAYIMFTGNDAPRLWVRRVDATVPQPLAGTDDASFPFWSPDGAFIAFFADGKLRKVSASSGEVQTLCDAPAGEGGTWSTDGTILFAPDQFSGLYRVSSAGGKPSPATTLDSALGEVSHRWPQFLPDGRHFLYLTMIGPSGVSAPPSGAALENGRQIWVGDLDSPQRSVVLRGTIRSLYAAGHLVFVRDRALVAQPFDVDTLEVSSEPVIVASEIAAAPVNGRSAFSVAGTGALVYRSGTPWSRSELAWFHRSGKRLDTIGEPAAYNEIRISPDNRRLGVHIGDAVAGDVWIVDLERGGTLSRLTLTANEPEFGLTFSPDGAYVGYASGESATTLFRHPINGTGQPEALFQSPAPKRPQAWSVDGRHIVFNQAGERSGTDLAMFDIENYEPRPLLQTPFAERNVALSPDGRWYAFDSNKASPDGYAVYVRPFPTGDREIRISPGEGTFPQWAANGREIFYISNRDLMAVPVTPGTPPRFGSAVKLFTAPVSVAGLGSYAVSSDGQRFVVIDRLAATDGGLAPLTVVLNWMESLPR